MSNLINKSALSFGAAEFLQKAGQPQPVVHCAYYSCVQLMKHVLISKHGYSDATIESERTQASSQIHVFLINKLIGKLRDANKDWEEFSEEIGKLKKLRGDVDYSDKPVIDSYKSAVAIDKARSLNRILKTLL